ncbi:hypothetical protein SAMN05216352_104249 [Alteribacillus bidgolensis]|uniref:Uncharacterized protein n=1 Tax=Alteribacillus bidgolensis TaxID=930129 RepID=A0A1G8HH15_9BACI|nr:hypothetical protein SAMN05216352_104249 [Alteribacillus bidgolensis]
MKRFFSHLFDIMDEVAELRKQAEKILEENRK